MPKLFHVIESQQFDRPMLDGELFPLAEEMELSLKKKRRLDILRDRLMLRLFTEPSSRTLLSFGSAMWHLGGDVDGSEHAREFSSMVKGESLEDTMRTVEGYCYDVIVLRYHEAGGAKRASESLEHTPLINAGDGAGQHPTQAVLDAYTIVRERGSLDGVRVAMVGDLSNGRTVRSLCYLLTKYNGVCLYFVAHPAVQMKQDIKDYLMRRGVVFYEVEDVHDIAGEVDVIYATRVQRERFGDKIEAYNRVRDLNLIDRSVLGLLQEHAIIMHPLPRNSEGGKPEILPEVDSDPRAAYFRQAHNGLYVRMALLKMIVAS
jgi:aspartate carbamoyltransferase catalytic subunit